MLLRFSRLPLFTCSELCGVFGTSHLILAYQFRFHMWFTFGPNIGKPNKNQNIDSDNLYYTVPFRMVYEDASNDSEYTVALMHKQTFHFSKLSDSFMRHSTVTRCSLCPTYQLSDCGQHYLSAVISETKIKVSFMIVILSQINWIFQ